MNNSDAIPIITLDGPSGAGKGKIGLTLAQLLGWHFLDSGVFYRLLAFEAKERNITLDNAAMLADLALTIQPVFSIEKQPSLRLNVFWKDINITQKLRTEACALNAAKVSIYPGVRQALLQRQRNFKKQPGLIADGRDMGTNVFPEANYKFFLTASSEIRAQRRYLQLKRQGKYVNLNEIHSTILQRDELDQTRSIAKLKARPEADVIDTSDLSITQVVSIIYQKLSAIGLPTQTQNAAE